MQEAQLKHKIEQMFNGEHVSADSIATMQHMDCIVLTTLLTMFGRVLLQINSTENRAVLHVALRAPRSTVSVETNTDSYTLLSWNDEDESYIVENAHGVALRTISLRFAPHSLAILALHGVLMHESMRRLQYCIEDVRHIALVCSAAQEIIVDGQNVVPGVWEVLDKIRSFSDTVRSGKWVSWATLLLVSAHTRPRPSIAFPCSLSLVSISSLPLLSRTFPSLHRAALSTRCPRIGLDLPSCTVVHFTVFPHIFPSRFRCSWARLASLSLMLWRLALEEVSSDPSLCTLPS